MAQCPLEGGKAWDFMSAICNTCKFLPNLLAKYGPRWKHYCTSLDFCMQPDPPANSFHFQPLLSIQNSIATDAPPTAFPTRCRLYRGVRHWELDSKWKSSSNQAFRNSLLVYAVLWAFRSPETSGGRERRRREDGHKKQSQKSQNQIQRIAEWMPSSCLCVNSIQVVIIGITVIIPPQHAPLFGPSSLNFPFRGRLAGQSTTTTFCDLFSGWWSARVVAHHCRRLLDGVGCRVSCSLAFGWMDNGVCVI